MNELDRRQFGKILVVGVGGLALGNILRADQGLAPIHYASGDPLAGAPTRDVVIVGAGLSGLIAARELRKAGKTVLVLEARDRIGGRMYGKPTEVPGGYTDFGGQWVGKTQYAMQDLVNELKITSFDSYEEGRSIQAYNGARSGFNGDVSHLLKGICAVPGHFPGFPKNPLAQCLESKLPNCVHEPKEAEIWNALLKISKTVPPDSPWETPNAKALDGKTFQQWLDQHGSSGYTSWLPPMQSRIGGSGGFEPSQVSLLHMAWTQKVGAQSETPEQWLLFGGAGQIPAMLADEMRDDIVLNAPVQRIQQLPGGVQVTIPGGLTVAAKAVIVAIPPNLRKKITFDPVLPADYMKFMDQTHMGSMSKVHAVYDRAFWRDDCLSGSAAGNLKTCEFIADSSSPSGQPGILTSFIAGDRNREIGGLPDEKVRELVLDDYAYYFGPRAKNPRQFIYFNWDKQEWTGGAFTNYLGLNVWTTSGRIGWRAPVGGIFWAGTETSAAWPGYFDGAVRAGKRAAKEVKNQFKWT